MKTLLEIATDLVNQYKNDDSASDLVANAERIINEQLTETQKTVFNSVSAKIGDRSYYFADSIKDCAKRTGLKQSTVRRAFTQLRAKDLMFLECERRGLWAVGAA